MENSNEPMNVYNFKGSNGKYSKLFPLFVVLIALSIWLISGFRQVSPTEVAVVERFGKIVAVKSSGIHYGLRGIDVYNRIQINQQNVQDEYNTATRDMQSVNQIVQTQYTIDSSKAESLYLKFLNNHADSIIKPILSQSIKETASKFTIEELISRRAELGQNMTDTAKERLESYGIKIISIQIVNLELPEEYRNAVEQKKVAEQRVQKATAELAEAKIKAEANKVTSASYDENIKYKEFLDKWDGKLPLYQGGDGGLNMLLPSVQ
ncbi:MAG: prohibitin family protein [Firmicutes bacterium]|nr:prohibitin family protein [Bacillota bacterium]